MVVLHVAGLPVDVADVVLVHELVQQDLASVLDDEPD
jgi:hypothetical protein